MFDNVEEISPHEFVIGGVKFTYVYGGYTKNTTADEIIVYKPLSYFRYYIETLEKRSVWPQTMVELGIAEGGSALAFALLLPSVKFVAIDIRKPNPHVLQHIERLGLSDRLKLYYETSQDDEATINKIMAAEFSGKVDVILDDASHDYGLSRRSFEILFPYVSDQRFYILEDWAVAHWPGQSDDKLTTAALSNLVFEFCMLSATRGDLIREIIVSAATVIIRVGSTSSIASEFKLDGAYKNRGNPLSLI